MDSTTLQLNAIVSKLTDFADSDLLHEIGRLTLADADAKDGKVLFIMRASANQFSSASGESISGPTFIGVFASPTKRECGLHAVNPTITRNNPSVTMHEVKKFLRYLMKLRPAMLELLFTEFDHYCSREWEMLRENTHRIVSTQFASRALEVANGNTDKYCHVKFKRNPMRIQQAMYIVTRMLDSIQSLVVHGKMNLKLVSKDYLDEILAGKYDSDALKCAAKDRIAKIKTQISENVIGLRAEVDLEFLNEWLIERVRRTYM